MFDPDAHMPRINRGMVYLGACLIAGIRLAREKVNVRVVPTSAAVDESVDLALTDHHFRDSFSEAATNVTVSKCPLYSPSVRREGTCDDEFVNSAHDS